MPPIFGMIQRGGAAVVWMPENVQQTTNPPLIERPIAPETRILQNGPLPWASLGSSATSVSGAKARSDLLRNYWWHNGANRPESISNQNQLAFGADFVWQIADLSVHGGFSWDPRLTGRESA
jgi:hypothetical protein